MRSLGMILGWLLFAWFNLLFVGIPGLSGERLRLTDQGAWQYVFLDGFLGIGLIGLLLRTPWAPRLLLLALAVWGGLQFRAHWVPMFFGASPEFVQRYNAIFGGYWRILPYSDSRVVPDAFHTVQSLLILATAITLVFYLVA